MKPSLKKSSCQRDSRLSGGGEGGTLTLVRYQVPGEKKGKFAVIRDELVLAGFLAEEDLDGLLLFEALDFTLEPSKMRLP